jgi:thiamine biosynthesis lipoprotein
MGTVASFTVYGSSDAIARGVALACVRLHADEAMHSVWIEDSVASQMRRGAIAISDAPSPIAEVFMRCLIARRLSDGWFNPWLMPGGYDPTGLVKDRPAMRALDELRSAGCEAGMVNVGGDVATFGKPGGRTWQVGVRHPLAADRLAFAVRSPGAVATSGEYELGRHTINVRSGRAETSALSATVTGFELDIADALAIALAAAGAQLLPAVEDLTGYEACIVQGDGAMYATPDFPFVHD